MTNAVDVLSSVIQSVIRDEYTFREAFLCVEMADIEQNSSFKYSYMKDRVNGMISECETMADIQKLFFNHHQS